MVFVLRSSHTAPRRVLRCSLVLSVLLLVRLFPLVSPCLVLPPPFLPVRHTRAEPSAEQSSVRGGISMAAEQRGAAPGRRLRRRRSVVPR